MGRIEDHARRQRALAELEAARKRDAELAENRQRAEQQRAAEVRADREQAIRAAASAQAARVTEPIVKNAEIRSLLEEMRNKHWGRGTIKETSYTNRDGTTRTTLKLSHSYEVTEMKDFGDEIKEPVRAQYSDSIEVNITHREAGEHEIEIRSDVGAEHLYDRYGSLTHLLEPMPHTIRRFTDATPSSNIEEVLLEHLGKDLNARRGSEGGMPKDREARARGARRRRR